ncbi:MAG: hypothetical protein R2844_04440 [Caldilineales bacterium]
MDGDLVTTVKLGWMWFDDDPKTSLEDKLRQASERYRQKFGHKPRLCYINGGALAEPQPAIGALQTRGVGNVSPGYFLFVVESEPSASPVT